MFGSHFENVGEFTPSYMPNWTPESSNWWWPSGSSPSWYTPESSTFGFPETSSNFNWFLRKAVRPESSIFSSRRSILRELTGHEDTFSTSNIEKINAKLLVKIVNKLALINPITIEKIITRPESRLLISKVLRTAEPETLYLIERIVRKVVPRVVREKVERRILKKLVRSTLFSKRSSILSSVYSPRPEKYIMKKLIKKALRNTPYNPMMLCNLCESVCTGYSYSTPYSYNMPICKMCTKMCPTTFSMRTSRRHHSVKSVEKKLIKKVLRNVVAKEIYAKELLKTVVPSKKSLYSSLNSNVDICSICSTVCEPTVNFYTTTRVSPICNTCNVVCSSPSYYKVKTMNKLYSRLF
jgi:ferredoxin